MLIHTPRPDLCLDFANTLGGRGCAAPDETLHRVEDLFDWLAGSAGVEAGVLDAARRHAGGAEAGLWFSDAIALREALYRLFSGLIAGAPSADPDLALLNRALAAAPARGEIASAESGFVWQVRETSAFAAGLLVPIAWSAADLLAQPDHARLRRCANDECLWLFLDHSKSGTRRWCDMASCGNRAKAQRHYRKRRAAR